MTRLRSLRNPLFGTRRIRPVLNSPLAIAPPTQLEELQVRIGVLYLMQRTTIVAPPTALGIVNANQTDVIISVIVSLLPCCLSCRTPSIQVLRVVVLYLLIPGLSGDHIASIM